MTLLLLLLLQLPNDPNVVMFEWCLHTDDHY
jgi:hypothetical protein